MSALDIYDRACRKIADLPAEWRGMIFKSVGHPADHQGVIVTGAVAPLITRGPNKGEPNWRKRDFSTEQQVYVSHADYVAARDAGDPA